MTKDKDIKTVVPPLRFPEFRDAEGWENTTLGAIAEFHKGKGISKSDITVNGNLPCIRYGELYTHYNETINSIVSYTGLLSDDLVLSQVNDVIIPASGETKEDIATASCVMMDNIALGGDLNIIRSRVNGVFLSYYLNNAKKYEISQLAQGYSVVHLYAEQLKKLQICIPKIKEQRRIAGCLGGLDDLINAVADKIEALKEHKKGLMQQLFPADGKTTPTLRFPEFQNAGDWQAVSLGNIATFINGRAYKQDELLESGKYRVLRVGNFFSNTNWYYSDLELDENKYCDKGDLLYAWSASFGPIIWNEDKVIFHYHIWKVIEHKGISKDFLLVLLDNETERIKNQQANGLGLLHITKGAIEGWKTRIPKNIPEQQKIANCLFSVEELISAEINKLNLLKAHRKGLMQQLFPTLNE